MAFGQSSGGFGGSGNGIDYAALSKVANVNSDRQKKIDRLLQIIAENNKKIEGYNKEAAKQDMIASVGDFATNQAANSARFALDNTSKLLGATNNPVANILKPFQKSANQLSNNILDYQKKNTGFEEPKTSGDLGVLSDLEHGKYGGLGQIVTAPIGGIVRTGENVVDLTQHAVNPAKNKPVEDRKIIADLALAGIDLATLGTGGEVVGAAKEAKTVAKPALEIIKNIVKTGAKGAALGAAGTGAYTVSEGGTNEEALKAAQTGAIVGGVLGTTAQTIAEGAGAISRRIEEKQARKAELAAQIIKDAANSKRANTKAQNAAKLEIELLNNGIEEDKAALAELQAKAKSGVEQVEVKDREAIKFNKQLEANRLAGESVPGERSVVLGNEPVEPKVPASVGAAGGSPVESSGGKIVKQSTPILPGQVAENLPETKVIEKPVDAGKILQQMEKTKGSIRANESKIARLGEELNQLAADRTRIDIDKIAKLQDNSRGVISKTISTIPVVRNLQTAMNNIAAFGENREGEVLSNKLRIQRYISNVSKNSGERVIRTFNKLADEEQAKIVEEITTATDRSRLTGMAKNVAELLDTRTEELRKLGVNVGQVEGYFPRLLDPTKKEDITNWLEQNGRKDDATLVKELYERKLSPQKADIEFHRATQELPEEFYIKKPADVLSNWNKETSARLAEAQTWGADVSGLGEAMKGLSSKQQKYIKNIYNVQRFGNDVTEMTPILKGLRGFETITKMPLSVLSNSMQSVNTATEAGIGRTAKNILKFATSKEFRANLYEKALDYGVDLNTITDDLAQNTYGKTKMVSGAEAVLKYTGFNNAEEFNRLIGTASGEDLIKNISKDPLKSANARMLRRYGLNPEVIAKRGSVTQAEIAKGVNEFVLKTQFGADAIDLPAYTTGSELGKTISQLGKFSMKQSEFLKDSVVKEFSKGNVKPLVRYLFLGTAAGEAVNVVRNTITGKKREYSIKEVIDGVSEGDWSKALTRFNEDISRAGGFGFMVDAYESSKFGETGFEKILKGVGGPGFNDAYDLLINAAGFFSDEASRDYYGGKLVKQGVRSVPYVDPILTALKKNGADFGNKTLNDIAEPYDPRTSKYYDMKKQYGLTSVTSKDINDAVKAERETGDISNTSFAGAVANAMQSTKRSDVSKQELADLMSNLGIKKGTAESFSKNYVKTKANTKNQLSKEEKKLANMSKLERNKQLKSMGKTISDYPKLEAFLAGSEE